MKLALHHINLATQKVAEMDAFYRDILGLEVPRTDSPALEKDKGYSGEVAFVGGGRIRTHHARKDVLAGFRTGQIVNPVARGHVAYRTDDIAAFEARLDAHGVPCPDWGNRAVAGWHQIFFHDPDGNVIEIHQTSDAAP